MIEFIARIAVLCLDKKIERRTRIGISYRTQGRETAPSSECKKLLSYHLLPKMLASFIIDH
jgi:hypothetical protein